MRFFQLLISCWSLLLWQISAADAALAPIGPEQLRASQNIRSLEDKLELQGQQIRQMGKELGALESNLGDNNKRYENVLKVKTDLEAKIEQNRKKLQENAVLFQEEQQGAEKILRGIMVNALNQGESETSLALNQVMVQMLKEKIILVQNLNDKNQALTVAVNELEARLMEYNDVEKNLLGMIGNLETQKSEVHEKYKMGQILKGQLDAEYQGLRSKIQEQRKRTASAVATNRNIPPAQEQRTNDPIALTFHPPLEGFTDIEHGNKGITFRFEGKRPVTATSEGKIVYSGTLSAYGNVVMIDHGDDTRSVILGPFTPKVEKGGLVGKGDIVGYTTDSKKDLTAGKLYFEVRKKNRVQNTILLMDKNALYKNNYIDSGSVAKDNSDKTVL